MAYVYQGGGALDYRACHYGASRVQFRGPPARLDGNHIAVLGGTETYGKFIPAPWPDLLSRLTGAEVANLGAVNAGVDLYLNEPSVMEVAAQARVTVVQVMGAHNLSNRYYAVHPRRNDRFLGATPLLRTLFREADFTEYNFTRHLLAGLHRISSQRFDRLAEELRQCWLLKMRMLLQELPGRKVLLWFADQAPRPREPHASPEGDPMLVTREMVDAMRHLVTDYVELVVSPQMRLTGTEGMIFSAMEEPAALSLPGPSAHEELATELARVLAS